MKGKRRRHDAGFKARVALEALKGQKTTQQIAAEYEIHPTQVSDWKKTLLEGIGGAFEGKGSGEKEDFEAEREKLHSKICPNRNLCSPCGACQAGFSCQSKKISSNSGRKLDGNKLEERSAVFIPSHSFTGWNHDNCHFSFFPGIQVTEEIVCGIMNKMVRC